MGELADGDRVTLSLTDIASHGAALGRHGEQVVFAEFGIPGETVVVEVEQVKRRFASGRVVEVVEASPDRVMPPCPYFGTCGGCQWQHIAYGRQLQLKRDIVRSQLRRIGHFADAPVAETVPSPDEYGYRNHIRLTVDAAGALGYVARPGEGYRFLRVDNCPIAHPALNAALAALQDRSIDAPHVSLRYGVRTGQLAIQPDLRSAVPSLPSGQDAYEEQLLGRRFRVSAGSFFQVNTPQAERLVTLVQERLALRGDDVLVDAYAGVGTFTVLLAASAGYVYGIEASPAAAADARHNAAGLANVEIHEGNVEDLLGTGVIARRPDAVLLDPPREGCHQRALDALLKRRPRRVVYVSCDAATLARDLRRLCDGGYTLHDVTPIDMFPQTHHIESVATLHRA